MCRGHRVVPRSEVPDQRPGSAVLFAGGVIAVPVLFHSSVSLLHPVDLRTIDQRFERYRLVQPRAEQLLLRSLSDYGQISPVVVCRRRDARYSTMASSGCGRRGSWAASSVWRRGPGEGRTPSLRSSRDRQEAVRFPVGRPRKHSLTIAARSRRNADGSAVQARAPGHDHSASKRLHGDRRICCSCLGNGESKARISRNA